MKVFFMIMLSALATGAAIFFMANENLETSSEEVQIVFVNSSEGRYHIILQRRLQNGMLSDYLCDKSITDHSKSILRVESGVYHIRIVDDQGNEIEEFDDYSFVDHFEGEMDPPYYVNINRASNFVIADLDILYQQKETSYSDIKIVKLYNGKTPFQLGKKFAKNLLDGDENIPHKKMSKDHLYGIYEIPSFVALNNIETFVTAQVRTHFEY